MGSRERKLDIINIEMVLEAVRVYQMTKGGGVKGEKWSEDRTLGAPIERSIGGEETEL